MNKKLIIGFIIIFLLAVGGIVYWQYFQETVSNGMPPTTNGGGPTEEVSPKVVDQGIFTEEEVNALTNITPEKGTFYSVEHKNESFGFSLFEFAKVEDAQKFFEEDVLETTEKGMEEISAEKNSIEVNEFSGYIYMSLQQPKGSAVILQNEQTILILNTVNTEKDNIQTIIKWFIQEYIKS